MSEFKLEGAAALKAKLAEVSEDMRLRGGRAALRRASALVVAKAKQNAMRLDDPETGRQIAFNIEQRWNGRLFKQTGNLGFRIGVAGAAKSEKTNPDLGLGSKTFHWRFLELGTEKMAATPFMQPALESQAEAVGQEFIQQYEAALDRALKRARKS